MQKRKRYTKEFKLDAVNLVLEQGYNCVGSPDEGVAVIRTLS